MALITCPECGKHISDTCESCPHCGFRLKAKKGKGIFKCAEPQWGSIIRWNCFLKDARTKKEIARFRQGESFVYEVDHPVEIEISMSKGFIGKPIVKLQPGDKKEFYIAVRWSSVTVKEVDLS